MRNMFMCALYTHFYCLLGEQFARRRLADAIGKLARLADDPVDHILEAFPPAIGILGKIADAHLLYFPRHRRDVDAARDEARLLQEARGAREEGRR